MTPLGPPGAPTGATVTGGNAQATVTFTAPASNGGSPITGYTVISNPAGGVDSNAGTTGLSHVITGLTNGTAYTFTVTATNANGTGAASTPSNSVTPAAAPILQNVVLRKVHGGAGTFDLTLSSVLTNPTTEPRLGPAQTIVFQFDKPVVGGTAAVTEGTAVIGTVTFAGNEMTVNLTGVNNQQYVTVAVSNVVAADGGTGGSGTVRIGFLPGDVSQNRVVTVADVGLVNAQLAQPVTAANYLKDVNASGTLTVGDKGLTNANLTKSLPAP